MVKFDYYSTIVTIQLKQLLFNDNFKQVISSHWIADIPASSDELSVSSSLILSTRSSLPQLLNALADFSYVAFDPSLCFHLFSIASLCASTDRGSNPKISSSSALVRSGRGLAIVWLLVRSHADTFSNTAASTSCTWQKDILWVVQNDHRLTVVMVLDKETT